MDQKLNQYGMIRAIVAGASSPFTNKRFGATIFNSKGVLVGEGYLTTLITEAQRSGTDFQNDQQNNKTSNDFSNVITAICNAIVNASETAGCTLYTAGFPSRDCVKLIVSVGISTVFIMEDPSLITMTTDQKRIIDDLGIRDVQVRFLKIKGFTHNLIRELNEAFNSNQ